MANLKDKNTIIALVIIGIILVLISMAGVDNFVLILGIILLIAGAFIFLRERMMKKRNGRR